MAGQVGSVLMLALTVTLAAVPVTIVALNPAAPSCSWTGGGGRGVRVLFCDQDRDRMVCDGYLYGTRYTPNEDGGLTLHERRFVCRGAWLHDDAPTMPTPPEDPPAPGQCLLDPSLLYGVVWVNSHFTFGCAEACPLGVKVQSLDASMAPCVLS